MGPGGCRWRAQLLATIKKKKTLLTVPQRSCSTHCGRNVAGRRMVVVTAATSYSRSLARAGQPSGDAGTHTSVGGLEKIPHRQNFTHAPRLRRCVLVGRACAPARAPPMTPVPFAESCREKARLRAGAGADERNVDRPALPVRGPFLQAFLQPRPPAAPPRQCGRTRLRNERREAICGERPLASRSRRPPALCQARLMPCAWGCRAPHTARVDIYIHPSRAMGTNPALQRLRCRGEIIGNQAKVMDEISKLLEAINRDTVATPPGILLYQQCFCHLRRLSTSMLKIWGANRGNASESGHGWSRQRVQGACCGCRPRPPSRARWMRIAGARCRQGVGRPGGWMARASQRRGTRRRHPCRPCRPGVCS